MSIENDSGRDCGLNRRRMEKDLAGGMISPTPMWDLICVSWMDNLCDIFGKI